MPIIVQVNFNFMHFHSAFLFGSLIFLFFESSTRIEAEARRRGESKCHRISLRNSFALESRDLV